jgi:membrane associated rhomboid family serine protease
MGEGPVGGTVLITLMRRWLWRLRSILYLAPTAIVLAVVCFFIYSVSAIAERTVFAYGPGFNYTYTFGQAFQALFGLNWTLLTSGFYWQPVTYIFLHDNGLHLFFNTIVILLFGSGVEAEVGSKRFLGIFFLGGIVGGLGWLAMLALSPYLPSLPDVAGWVPAWFRTILPKTTGQETLAGSMCVGASGAVFSLIGAYAAMFPARKVYVLLIVIPLRLSARWLAIALMALSVFEIVFIQAQVAYSAHIIGGLAGYAYGLWLNKRGYYGD